MIISQLQFVETFTEDLLNINMIHEGVFKLEKNVFDPKQAFSFIEEMFEQKAMSKKISITFKSVETLQMPVLQKLLIPQLQIVEKELPNRLVGDERRFKQVLINLIKNAYKFTGVGGKIDIQTSYDQKSGIMQVYVSDDGAGIAAEDIDRLFSRFGKLHRTAELNNEGIGLGLTIVKQIVEASGGKISVSSDGKGKGSVFYFTMKLPIYNALEHAGIDSNA